MPVASAQQRQAQWLHRGCRRFFSRGFHTSVTLAAAAPSSLNPRYFWSARVRS